MHRWRQSCPKIIANEAHKHRQMQELLSASLSFLSGSSWFREATPCSVTIFNLLINQDGYITVQISVLGWGNISKYLDRQWSSAKTGEALTLWSPPLTSYPFSAQRHILLSKGRMQVCRSIFSTLFNNLHNLLVFPYFLDLIWSYLLIRSPHS